MFTSRAEYRLRLRADNADQRLTALGLAAGCVGSARAAVWRRKEAALAAGRQQVSSLKATPNLLSAHGIEVSRNGVPRSAFGLLAMPKVTMAQLSSLWPELAELDAEIVEQIEIDALYAGYLARQDADVAAFRRDEALALPDGLDYRAIGGLSTEVCEKLHHARPETLGAAARISGVTPAAIVAILRHVQHGTSAVGD